MAPNDLSVVGNGSIPKIHR